MLARCFVCKCSGGSAQHETLCPSAVDFPAGPRRSATQTALWKRESLRIKVGGDPAIGEVLLLVSCFQKARTGDNVSPIPGQGQQIVWGSAVQVPPREIRYFRTDLQSEASKGQTHEMTLWRSCFCDRKAAGQKGPACARNETQRVSKNTAFSFENWVCAFACVKNGRPRVSFTPTLRRRNQMQPSPAPWHILRTKEQTCTPYSVCASGFGMRRIEFD